MSVLNVKAMRWTATVGAAVALGIWGCGGGGGGETRTVASVAVAEGQSIGVNQTKYLTATALDAQGQTISTSPTSFKWRVQTGSSFLRFQSDGRAVGVAQGVPTVVASLNGVESAPTAVTVTPTPSGGCTSTTYQPNYVDAILTPNIPNVSGNFRFWTRTPLRIRFVRDANWTQALEATFRLGMQQWQAATSNGIAFVDTEDTNANDIQVRFRPAAELPSTAIGVTYATYDPTTREMSFARIEIANDLETTAMSLSTCSHELGHALGIGGHSPNENDLMFYAENGTTTTTTRDLNTLRTVYCDVFPGSATRSASRNLVTEVIY
jgi:hypothetical protein